MQGAASVYDGVWMYQMTDKGLALEITVRAPSIQKTTTSTSRRDTTRLLFSRERRRIVSQFRLIYFWAGSLYALTNNATVIAT
jgi:hypothetical protein